jgi:predicted HicB family RNase H-like nuclease
VVKAATDHIAAYLQQPNVEATMQMYQAYCTAEGTEPSSASLDKFMVQINEQLKLRQIKPDALVLYTLRFNVATRLRLPE